VTFLDARSLKSRQDLLDEFSADALATTVGTYGKVMNVSSPPIVTAEDRADKGALRILCKQAHIRISLKIEPNALFGISTTQANPFRLFPQGHHFLIGIQSERRDDEVHLFQPASAP